MSRPECRRLPGSPEIRRGILELAIALGVQALADGLDIQGSEELAMRMAATAMTFSQAGPKLADATRADERRIAAVLRNLEEEAAHPLSLDRLAGTAGMSPYHFLRVFQRVTGQTPWTDPEP